MPQKVCNIPVAVIARSQNIRAFYSAARKSAAENKSHKHRAQQQIRGKISRMGCDMLCFAQTSCNMALHAASMSK